MEKALLTIPEFCASRNISRTRAYEELKAGRLKAKKVGDRTLIPAEAAQEWAASLPDYDPTKQAAA